MLFPLPASQVDPKSRTSRTPLLLNIILLLSSSYWTLPGPKFNTPFSLRSLRGLKPIIFELLRKKLLPLALFRLQVLPKRPLLISPFKLMCRYPVLTPGFSPKCSLLPNHLLTPLLCHLRSLLRNFADYHLPRPHTVPCQYWRPSSSILSKPSALTPLS